MYYLRSIPFQTPLANPGLLRLHLIKPVSHFSLFNNLTNSIPSWSPFPPWLVSRKANLRSLYRKLLKTSSQFQYDLYRTFLATHIKERFRFYQKIKSDKKIQFLIREAEAAHRRLLNCLEGDESELKLLDDLAWGKIGRMKVVLDSINRNPKSEFIAHKFTFDTRSRKSKLIDRHPSRAIPIDPRVYQPPELVSPPRVMQPHTSKPILARTSFLVAFVRFQGRPQPHWLSMLLHRIRVKNVKSLDRYRTLLDYLEMARFEKNLVYEATGSLEADGYEEELLAAIDDLKVNFEQRRINYQKRVNAFAVRNNLYIPLDSQSAIPIIETAKLN